ncbi:hypothetical protein EDD15DRAFT_1329130 [Pisolithus albus]|nr:hypothetical protein EDD15DRAFT_1329130 [Pisolithus albus]
MFAMIPDDIMEQSPGPTWTALREPTETSSVMRSSDDDGDDELEVENELTDMPLQKRKAQYSPSNAVRANKFPRLGLGGPFNTNHGAEGMESNENGPSDAAPSVSTSHTLSTRSINKFTSTKSSLVGDSSSDEFGGTLTQVIRQANSKERLDVRKENGARRGSQGDVPHRVVARKHVNGGPRVSTGSLLHSVRRSNDPDSSARTRVRPKRNALVVNRNALPTHVRPLDAARRRSKPECGPWKSHNHIQLFQGSNSHIKRFGGQFSALPRTNTSSQRSNISQCEEIPQHTTLWS